jgi:hypothetical protein
MRLRLFVATLFCVLAVPALAQDPISLSTTLRAFEEVPALSSFGNGRFEAEISADLTEMSWTITIPDLPSAVTQAHIHLGQQGVNGGIMVFFCTNLGNGPAGTPNCPENGGTLTGTFDADDIIGPAAQGVTSGQFFEFQRAVRNNSGYVNVHTVQYPGGEVRGQVRVNPTP